MNSWSFRTKPRSMVKIVEWLPYFLSFEGQNWNKQVSGKRCSLGNKIHPVRREYVFLSKNEFILEEYKNKEEFISGNFDTQAKESDARNDKASFEFYGFAYVDKKGMIKKTKIGNLIKEGKANSDHLMKQLLKIQYPSPINNNWDVKSYIFPMQVILEIYKEFEYINKYEAGFLFMCNDISKKENLITAIKKFRNKVSTVTNKKKTKEIDKIFTEVKGRYFSENKNKSETYYKDYSDALFRCLEYTGYFYQSGRGNFSKLRINEHSKIKIKLLQDDYNFIFNPEINKEIFMDWFGDPYNMRLPWEKNETKKLVINEKMSILKSKIETAKLSISNFDSSVFNDILEVNIDELEENEISEFEDILSNSITDMNEYLFVKYLSKTNEARSTILDKFIDISNNEDDAALWLECNTWKSIVAIKGSQNVIRNFKIEEDLTPKSFAPGRGNTPDMEVYFNNYILLPEVSLMSGVRQWEHEGSSVIDHVYHKIKTYTDKDVFGLFISKTMNVRTIWQFFILNKHSWIGKAVPVIPFTIQQYYHILDYVYKYEISFEEFNSLIISVHKKTFDYEDFEEWNKAIPEIIQEWSENKIKLAK